MVENPLSPPRIVVRRTMKVRFFHERNLEALENAINDWLAERPDREIAEMSQSVVPEAGARGPGDREVIVSVWYIDD